MNDVALRANDVLRNDVMLRINEVALRASGHAFGEGYGLSPSLKRPPFWAVVIQRRNSQKKFITIYLHGDPFKPALQSYCNS